MKRKRRDPKRRDHELPSPIRIIRRIALALHGAPLTKEHLVEAVLAYPPARRAAARVTPLTEAQLLPRPRKPSELPQDDSSIPWPEDLEFETDELDGGDRTRDDRAFANLDNFVLKLYSCTLDMLWYRPKIAQTFRELRRRVDRARRAASREIKAQRAPVAALAAAILDRGMRQLDGARKGAPEPVFVFGYPGHGATAILKIFARELGCRFVTIDDQITTTVEFIRAVENKPPSLVEVTGFPSCTPGHAVHSILSYYQNGQAAHEEFEGLGFHDSSRNATDFENALGRCFVIFYINPPQRLMDAEEYTPEELVVMLRDQHRQESEHSVSVREAPPPFWDLIRNHNSVIIRRTDCRHMAHRLYCECRSALKMIRRNLPWLDLRVESKLRLAALLILARGYPAPRELEGAMLRLLLDAADRIPVKSGGAWVLSIAPTQSELPPVLSMRSRPSRVWFERLEKQAKQQSYSGHRLTYRVTLDEAGRRVLITDLTMRAPKAVAGGSFLVAKPKLRFKDVIGMEEAKERLQSLVRYIRDPGSFTRLGTVPPRRILLAGPPGTGKTMLAQAFAGEVGLPFFAVSAAEIMSQKWAGWGASNLRDLFDAAQVYRPSVVFIDELDAFGSRTGMGTGEVAMDMKSVLNTLLVLLDGVNSASDIIVIGATNRPDDLDDALLRPKRFGTRIDCEPFKPDQRAALIRLHLAPEVCEGSYEDIVRYIVMRTAGPFSPADIEDLVNEAKLAAEKSGATRLTRDIIAGTIDNVVLGRKFRELSPEYRRSVARHEAGHAACLRALLPDRKIERITIGVRADTAGLTVMAEDEGKAQNFTRDELLSMIMVAMAGALAEEAARGHWDAGAGNDFNRATRLAACAVSDLGIGLGVRGAVLSYLTDKNEPWPEVFQEQVVRLVETCARETRRLMADLEPRIARLAEALEAREDLGHEDIDTALGALKVDRNALIARILDARAFDAASLCRSGRPATAPGRAVRTRRAVRKGTESLSSPVRVHSFSS